MICPDCGQELTEGANSLLFCDVCGHEVRIQTEEGSVDNAFATSSSPDLEGGAHEVNERYATFWIRALARIIDMILANIILIIAIAVAIFIAGFVTTVLGESLDLVTQKLANTAPTFLAAILAPICYETICEGFHGATLGKLICGLVVLQEDGSRCRPGPAFCRSAAFYIDGLFWGLVAAKSMSTSDQRQRYGDRWAHTVVVRRHSLPADMLYPTSRFVQVCTAAIAVDGIIICFVRLAGLI